MTYSFKKSCSFVYGKFQVCTKCIRFSFGENCERRFKKNTQKKKKKKKRIITIGVRLMAEHLKILQRENVWRVVPRSGKASDCIVTVSWQTQSRNHDSMIIPALLWEMYTHVHVARSWTTGWQCSAWLSAITGECIFFLHLSEWFCTVVVPTAVLREETTKP